MGLSQQAVWGIVGLIIGLPATVISLIEYASRRHRFWCSDIENGEGTVQLSSVESAHMAGVAATSTQAFTSDSTEIMRKPLQVLLLLGSSVLTAPAFPITGTITASTELAGTAQVAVAPTSSTSSHRTLDNWVSYHRSNTYEPKEDTFDEHNLKNNLAKIDSSTKSISDA